MVDELEAAIEDLLGQDLEAVDDAALHETVVSLQRLSGRLAAVRARFVSAWDGRGIWGNDRSRSAGARLARDAACAPATARGELRRARKLRTMPATAAALAVGDLSLDHADLLCSANHDPLTELFARDEAHLVSEGRRLCFDDFNRTVAHWRNVADDDAAEDRATKVHQGRYLKASETLDGEIDLQGRLGPVDGAIFTGELGRLEKAMFEADWAAARAEHGDDARAEHLARTSLQRRADALVEMASRSTAMAPGSVPARPLFTLLLGYETFAGRVCELAKGTVVTTGQAASWLTEADIERVVFASPSRVIDVGRHTRLFTGGLRRAIEIRDRHCTEAGCRVPADQCQVDHIVEYGDGGPTTQDNGRLLCPGHNRKRPGRSTPPADGP